MKRVVSILATLFLVVALVIPALVCSCGGPEENVELIGFDISENCIIFHLSDGTDINFCPEPNPYLKRVYTCGDELCFEMSDGKKLSVSGITGLAGEDGEDGISINWLGTLTKAPINPQLNDAYYNSTYGISYIWDGNSWEIIAKDGATGARGLTGATGARGAQGLKGDTGECYCPILPLLPKTGEPDWEIIDGQTGALLHYSPEGDEFGYILDASGLAGCTWYSLIYYCDPWPGTGGFLIAKGQTDADGELFLIGEHDLNSDIPIAADDNYPDGGKIWLVLSADYDETAGEMTAWHPASYLFEYDLITYQDTG